jgi:hypothetical protein
MSSAGSIGFVAVAIAVIAYALVSAKAQRGILTPPMAFALVGVVVGAAGLGLIELDIEAGVVHGLAEITLILVLFTDASRIDLKLLVREHDLPVRLLLIGLPLTIALGAVVAVVVLDDFSWPAALVLAAVLASLSSAGGGRCAATSAMRRAPQEGQKPRPLHEKATSSSRLQREQRTRAKPKARIPQASPSARHAPPERPR